MFAEQSLSLNGTPGELWLVVLVGVTFAGLTLATGRLLQRRPARRPAPPPPPPAAKKPAPHDPFVYGSATEKRTAHRRSGNSVEVLLIDAQRQTSPVTGLVLDRSLGGLCLLVNHEIRPGTVLGVRPATAGESVHWLDIEVRSCRQTREGWELGCQFQKAPAWGVLLLFG
jgi:hypothetical protein